MPYTLEDAILDIIQLGRYRCDSSFGQYPLGVRDALGKLIPLINQDHPNARGVTIRERLADFDDQIARP